MIHGICFEYTMHMCCAVIQIHKWLKLLWKTILKFINLSHTKYKSIHCSSILLFATGRWSSRRHRGGVIIIKRKLVINIGYIGRWTWHVNYAKRFMHMIGSIKLCNENRIDQAWWSWRKAIPSARTNATHDTMNGNHKCLESFTANHITIAVSWAVKIFSIWLISFWTEKPQNRFIACDFYALLALQPTVPIF